jgi:hypothetical protein
MLERNKFLCYSHNWIYYFPHDIERVPSTRGKVWSVVCAYPFGSLLHAPFVIVTPVYRFVYMIEVCSLDAQTREVW